MVPLQIIILALVVLLYPGNRGGPGMDAKWILGTVISSHFMLILFVWISGRRTAHLLHDTGTDGVRVAWKMERMVNWARWATVALAGLQVWGLGWGALVVGKKAAGGWGLGEWPWVLVPEIILLMPALVSWVFFWGSHYGVEKAMRERALAYRLAMGLPTHEMPRLGRYLSMQVRHNMYMLLPMLVATGVEGVARGLWRESRWANLSVGFGLVGVLLIVPWMITRVWNTEPLRGELRDRLDRLAKKYGVRFCNILIWKTENHVSNAAILGYLPFARYFLMSDALLESLTDRQIEAVFAHEVGHGRHRHVWWYAGAMAGAGMVAGSVAAVATWGMELWLKGATYGGGMVRGWLGHWGVGLDDVGMALEVALLGAFVVWGFGWISRRFEHQADWFATRHMGEELQEESVKARAAGTEIAALTEGEALEQGALVFAHSLEEVVRLAHRSAEKGGWLHPSVRRRGELLLELARSGEARRKFEGKMFWIRMAIALFFFAGVASMVPDLLAWWRGT